VDADDALRVPVTRAEGAHREPGVWRLGDHFQIGLAVLAPFFRLFPSPATPAGRPSSYQF
jgi:hypothetical protein